MDWGKKESLREGIGRCIDKIDPGREDTRYAYVRTGLKDRSSVLAPDTLHEYVHNPDFYPSSTELRTIAKNYKPFLQALNDCL